MKSNSTMRIVFIFIAIITALYLLYPTINLSMMSEVEKEELQKTDNDQLIELKSKAISLGLDLQGGMHVVLEVDVRKLMEKLAKYKNKEFVDALEETATRVDETDEDFVTVFEENLVKKEMRLERYYANADRRTREDVITFLNDQTVEAVDRSLEILRNRIDQFGVSEPTIQKAGGRRIILELAGVTDRNRVHRIIGKTALLEFKLLKDDVTTERVATRINEFIVSRISPNDTSKSSEVESDTTSTALEDLFGVTETSNDSTADSTSIAKNSLFEEGLFFQHPNDKNTLVVPVDNENKFKTIIELPEISKIIAETAGSAEFVWGSKKQLNDEFLQVYLVNAPVELSGETIIDTNPMQADLNDPSNIGKYEVSITLNDDGSKTFARVTGANIGKRLAIILDNKVYLAPNLQTKISNGRARITGMDTFDDAKDLSIILKAGALPAPVAIIEERTVGPSLGTDSIKSGGYSAALGLLIVMIFMVIYYRLSGFVANLALILNLVFIMAVMASFGATLTLPGIAGIILTIGMAVDANVLIFERVREEIRKGKTIRASLDQGYGKALITILDANVTTFIAGLVLYTFGSGPIKGFAVTLMIGIVASLFTAIIITRVIFNSVLDRSAVKQLSI
ncbi:MAG: protein translocase subunit SecD [Calditrichaeota bacterium]|nr:MAG: protein translocase subunit SecD [Calditrichota bacterium]MBL1204212.1 protein translocase subunit SecD [Calditrichota bacterium]NOG44042.1 protein translocase subunit SecD [Calditrichota bacterium]